MERPDYIPISYLNALEYCPRRFYYEFALGEMEVNVHVLEGILRHERSHSAGTEREGDEITMRRVYVYSESLSLAGFVDVVEVKDGQIYPVEYKKGRMGRWLNDHIQLCAQALCLEERTGQGIDYGYIFYFGSRRREQVDFTPELRAKTLASIERAFAILEQGVLPPPLERMAKCRDCSLEPICLPREVRCLNQEGGG